MQLSAPLLHVVSDERVFENAIETTDAAYLVLVRDGATLVDDAIRILNDTLEEFAKTELIYGDDTLVRRPAFSAVRLRGQDYLGPVLVFSVATLRSLGGVRPQASGAQGYDLALRFAAAGAHIVYVPSALATTTSPAVSPELAELHGEIVRHHLNEIAVLAEVSTLRDGNLELRYDVIGEPLVSIVIPTRGGSAQIAGVDRVLIIDAVRSILQRSTYSNIEFVIVADDETPQHVIDELSSLLGEKLSLVRWSKPFNFSAKMNRGAVHSRGEYVLLLNDDVEVLSDDWIERLLGLAQQPDIGLASGLLFFEDGTIQHGGHLYSYGQAGHIAIGWPAHGDDQLMSMQVDREVSGATAACAMLSIDDFWAVGGFSALFPGNYNDVDFCMKLRSLGRSVIWTPHVKLYHFESKTRVASVAPSELSAIRLRWNRRLQVDAYWPAYDNDRR